MLISGGVFATQAGCPSCFTVIRESQQVSPKDHTEVAAVLAAEYDYGSILMTRALHNEVAVRAGIPLRQYILEANEHYYGRAVEAPWWYARYVVMFNPSDSIHQNWQQENERVSHRWAGDSTFNEFYEQIFISDGEAVYRLRETVLVAYAENNSIPLEQIPSLQTDTEKWDVEMAHQQIHTALAARPNADVTQQ